VHLARVWRMAKLVPSWLPAPRHVAVHDVNSRYLFLLHL
jgi:hypothetical protein